VHVFDRIADLPAHPLIVHATVVFTPLLAALVIAYAAVPRLRDRIGWAVALSAFAAPVSAVAAKLSGEALARRMTGGGPYPAPVEEHSALAGVLVPLTVLLGAAALALVLLTRPGRATGPSKAARAATALVSAVAVLLALAVGYYAVLTGHSGATSVWGA